VRRLAFLSSVAFHGRVAAEVEAAELATVGARLLAKLVDLFILGTAGLTGVLVAALVLGRQPGLSLLVEWTLILASLVPQWALIVDRGQSLGKWLMRIRIVKQDGSPAGFLHGVVLRSWVTGWIWTVVCGSMLVDAACLLRDDRRALHDLLAGTKVVKV
jgi:uncharacterized RDD family membrane protein YckC